MFNGPLAGKAFQLTDEAFIGRQEVNTLSSSLTVQLPDSRVSRYHARIFIQRGDYYLEDLESTNGTFLNGCNVAGHEPVIIRKGNNVQVGETHMKFVPVQKSYSHDISASSARLSEIGLNEQNIDISKPQAKASINKSEH